MNHPAVASLLLSPLAYSLGWCLATLVGREWHIFQMRSIRRAQERLDVLRKSLAAEPGGITDVVLSTTATLTSKTVEVMQKEYDSIKTANLKLQRQLEEMRDVQKQQVMNDRHDVFIDSKGRKVVVGKSDGWRIKNNEWRRVTPFSYYEPPI